MSKRYDPAEFMLQQMEEIIGRLLDRRMGMLGSMTSLAPTGQTSKEGEKEEDVMLVDVEPVEGENPLLKKTSLPPTTGKRKKKGGKGKEGDVALGGTQPPPSDAPVGSRRKAPDPPPPPLSAPAQAEETWVAVVGRKQRRGTQRQLEGKEEGTTGRKAADSRRETTLVRRRKVPTTAAITIASRDGGYGEIIKTARKTIGEEAMREMGIKELRTRRAQTGAYVLEIPGGSIEERERKAKSLAERLSAVFGGNENIKISRLQKMAQVRIRDLDESLDAEEIVQVLANRGEGNSGVSDLGESPLPPTG